MLVENKIRINLQLFADSADKTEPATPKRRREAKEKGQVAKSQDLAQVSTLLGGIIMMNVLASQLYDLLVVETTKHLSQLDIEVLTTEVFKENLLRFIGVFFIIIAPILSTVLILGIVVNYLQVGFMFTLDPIKPSFEKMSPIKGLKQLFSMRKAVELLKTLIKLAIISYYGYLVVKGQMASFMELPYEDPIKGFVFIFDIIYSTVVKIAAGLFLVALFDYFYQKYEFEKSIKMSKQEIKDEYKQTEGDPQIKGKIKQMQRELLKKKMIEDVPKATVVITNPTHISIALKYERGMGAPEIVAKGVDHMAMRIREIATENKIPLIENKPLARAMYGVVEVGDEIPEEFYQAVAEILAVILD